MILLDTHGLLWVRAATRRLSDEAHRAVMASDEVAIAAISLWEIAMLVAKGRIEVEPPLSVYLQQVSTSVVVLPLDPAVASRAASLSRSMSTADPADHLICATAEVHGLPLVSADRRLGASGLQVIW